MRITRVRYRAVSLWLRSLVSSLEANFSQCHFVANIANYTSCTVRTVPTHEMATVINEDILKASVEVAGHVVALIRIIPTFICVTGIVHLDALLCCNIDTVVNVAGAGAQVDEWTVQSCR